MAVVPNGNSLIVLLGLIAVLVLTGCSAGADTSYNSSPSTVYEGTKLEGAAPDFRLVDHQGKSVALSDFRGKVVVLAFMDTRCDETCPLTAFELRTAYNSLGNIQEDVIFLGVNVNSNFNRPEDAAAFTAQHRLDEIATWHFLTGDPEDLEPVWEAYSIEVRPPEEPDEEDFEHTPGVYIIDRDGNLRWYVSTPLEEEGLVSPWNGPRLGEIMAKRVVEILE
jgi:cytochrome oxidase Cu insertion factor (SCO1/SenC/PrrC family)